MLQFQFHNKEELNAFIRLGQEIILELEAEKIRERDSFKKYEIAAQLELMEELMPQIYKKQFNQQLKNSVKLSKAVCLIIFQNRNIAIDIYADLLKNRLVETIHRNMV
jgi:hypothetical protein